MIRYTLVGFLLLLATSPLQATLIVGINPNPSTAAYVEYDPSTFSFNGPATVTSALGGASRPLESLAFDSDGHLNILFSDGGNLSGFIERWDVTNQSLLRTSALNIGDDHTNLTLGPNGILFFASHVTAINSNIVSEYNPSSGNVENQFFTNNSAGGGAGPVTSAVFDANGNLNISIELSPELSVIETFDVTTRTLLGTSAANIGRDHNGLTLGPNGNLFFAVHLTATNNNIISEYNPLTGNIVNQFFTNNLAGGGVPGPVTAGVFDSNGNLNLGIEMSPGVFVIETWDVNTRTLLGTSPAVPGLAALTELTAVPEPGGFALTALIAIIGLAGRQLRISLVPLVNRRPPDSDPPQRQLSQKRRGSPIVADRQEMAHNHGARSTHFLARLNRCLMTNPSNCSAEFSVATNRRPTTCLIATSRG